MTDSIAKLTALGTILSLLVLALPALAMPDTNRVPATNNKAGVVVTIPGHAVEVADDVFSLGTAIDPGSGKLVEGYAVVHPKRGFHHRPDHGGGPGGNSGSDSTTSRCFSFLAKDAKWKTVESWIVNPANTEGLSDSFVLNNLSNDITKWEEAAGTNVLGNGSTTANVLVADTSSPDGNNEVYFADVGNGGAIAVTIVWGVFGGRPSDRELVEWDQVYDDVDFSWSASGEAGKMDFENVATHEIGHSLGMGHPDDSCTDETMYRFAENGETKKQTLETGDRAGVAKLY